MAIDINQVDSIIFDMDGTLWDAMSTYVEVWNRAFAEYGVDGSITSDILLKGMGKPLNEIKEILGSQFEINVDSDSFLQRVYEIEDEIMPTMGGELYPGLVDGLKQLAKRYKLFLVSNCGENGLLNFMEFAGVKAYITDYVSYGMNPQSKSQNILMIKDKHNLKNPIYVGDTQGDSDQTHAAGLPFVFCSYGFGKCDDYELKIDTFGELVECLKCND